MLKNRAGLVALVGLAVATVFTVFVALPMMKHGKGPVADLANQASDAMKDVAKQATQAAGEVAKTVNDTVANGQTAVLEKMDRLKGDAGSAVTDMQSLFAGGKIPTPEQIASAKAKAETALKAVASFPLPEGVDATVTATAKALNENAPKWLGLVQAIPTDAEGAKKAIVALATAMGVAVSADMAAAPAPAPATEPAKPAETAAPSAGNAIIPSFDIVRVEKDGSMVVAGRGQPGSKIQIMNGETVIASTEVDKDGNFVAVLDNPLAPGDYSLVLKTTAPDGAVKTSDEVATVSVPKDKSGQLLAMVTKAGEASRILTAPEAPKPAETAAATPAAPATQPDASTTAPAANVAGTATAAAASAASTTSAPAASTTTPAAAVALPDLPAAASTIAGTAPVVSNAPATASAAAPAGAGTAAVANNTPVASAPAANGAATTTAPAADTNPSTPDVAVSAVELEGDRIFIAGNTKPGMLVRAYADDVLVGEIKSEASGAFVVEGKQALSVGKHTIRADVLDDKGVVVFRATVPFDRPEGEDVAVVAANDAAPGAPATLAMLGDGKFDQLRTEAGKALGLLKSLFAGGKVPTGEQLAAGRSSLQFALASLADFKLADTADAASVNLVSKVASGAAEALKLLKSLPQDPAAFGAALSSVETAVNAVVAPHSGEEASTSADATKAGSAATATPAVAEPAKPAATDAAPAGTAPAAPSVAATTEPTPAQAPANSVATKAATAEATAPAPASAEAVRATTEPKTTAQAPLKESKTTVIIRHGDTLWQISRRVYGRGIRYTTIYLANQDQIANPDIIEPGQVFGVPDKSVPDADAEAAHRKHLQEKK